MASSPVSFGAALTFAEQQLPGVISQNTTTPVLSTTATSILNNNADRIELIFFNLDVVDAFILFDPSVTTLKGYKLQAGGGFVIFKLRDDFTFLTQPVWGVSASATATLTVTEIFRQFIPPVRST